MSFITEDQYLEQLKTNPVKNCSKCDRKVKLSHDLAFIDCKDPTKIICQYCMSCVDLRPHVWKYRKFKGCITDGNRKPLDFYQRVCRKCGRIEDATS